MKRVRAPSRVLSPSSPSFSPLSSFLPSFLNPSTLVGGAVAKWQEPVLVAVGSSSLSSITCLTCPLSQPFFLSFFRSSGSAVMICLHALHAMATTTARRGPLRRRPGTYRLRRGWLVGWLVACTVCVCVAPVSNYLLLLLLLNSTTCRTLLRHRSSSSSSSSSSVTLLPPPIGRPSSHCSLARSIVKGAVCKVLASTLPSPHLSAQLEHTRRTFSSEHSCLCRFTIFLFGCCCCCLCLRTTVCVCTCKFFLSFLFRCGDNAISALTLPANKSYLAAYVCNSCS